MSRRERAPMELNQDDDAELERWKGEVYLDLNERRNPGTDEFAKGFNGGIIEARELIYSKLPKLFSRLSRQAGGTK